MALQSHFDTVLLGDGSDIFYKGVILNTNGTERLAGSPDRIEVDSLDLMRLYRGFAMPIMLQSFGFSIAGSQYDFVTSGDHYFVGKNTDGFVIVAQTKTEKALVVALARAGTELAQATEVVSKLIGQITEAGY